MFDNVLDKALSKALPVSHDLGDFDKCINWLRDSAFTCWDLTEDPEALRNQLDSWLIWISEYLMPGNTDMIALTAYCSVIYNCLTEKDCHFNIAAYFEED